VHKECNTVFEGLSSGKKNRALAGLRRSRRGMSVLDDKNQYIKSVAQSSEVCQAEKKPRLDVRGKSRHGMSVLDDKNQCIKSVTQSLKDCQAEKNRALTFEGSQDAVCQFCMKKTCTRV
jgi:hypothetical protein